MQHYNELRFYAFTNFYMSSIQHGIQTGHASVDLVQKYRREYEDAANSDYDYMKSTRLHLAISNRRTVDDWADNYKTYIILNGGQDSDINQAYELVSKTGFPFIDFREPGLGNIRTVVGILLPDRIFNMKRSFIDESITRGSPVYRCDNSDEIIYPNDNLYPFMEYFKSCSLAR